jgi:hypothetical protein
MAYLVGLYNDQPTSVATASASSIWDVVPGGLWTALWLTMRARLTCTE